MLSVVLVNGLFNDVFGKEKRFQRKILQISKLSE